MHVVTIIAFANFAAALIGRSLDPVLPQIAGDFRMDIHTVASLTTAFALPYAFVQPTIGALGDMFSKTRIMMACLVLLFLSCGLGALAPGFEALFGARIVMGIASGGVFPVTLALAGDLVPIEERQPAYARLIAANMTGTLAGSALGGLVADLVHWRAVLVMLFALVAIVTAIMVVALRRVELPAAGGVSLGSLFAGYREIFRNPQTWIVYPAVFCEGLCVLSLFPFVAAILAERGQGSATIAGIVISGFSIGGLIYSVSIKSILSRIRINPLMLIGGLVEAACLIAIAWTADWMAMLAFFVALGIGYYCLHGSLQIFGSELSPRARGSAIAWFATAFFLGQAAGPLVLGWGFASFGTAAPLMMLAFIMALVGFTASRRLWHKTQAS